MDKIKINYFVYIIIFFLFISLSANGIILQIIYHMKHHPSEYIFIIFNKNNWLLIHKMLSVSLSIGVIIHVAMHFNWIKDVLINNRLFENKYKNKSLVLLLITFILASLLGFISWAFNNSIIGYNIELRHVLVEIHDKITLILMLLFCIHLIKKIKWILSSTYSIIVDRNKN